MLSALSSSTVKAISRIGVGVKEGEGIFRLSLVQFGWEFSLSHSSFLQERKRKSEGS